MDKLSYAWGMAMGMQLKAMGVSDLNFDSFKDGVKVVFDGGTPEMSPEEAQKVINEYLEDLQKKAAETANAEAKAFLDENASKEGVKVTESGLQYKVLKEGDGAQPCAEDEVTVHYTGKLLNGIPGWTEGVQLMKEGAKYEFFIPSDLAYGPQGIPNVIPPHSTLIFEVELIKVNKKAE